MEEEDERAAERHARARARARQRTARKRRRGAVVDHRAPESEPSLDESSEESMLCLTGHIIQM